jgi:AGCS family alanine or glycine:cation symporter
MSQKFSDAVFISVPIGDSEFPIVVAWLLGAGLFFTFYFKFFSLRGMLHAVKIVLAPKQASCSGEISHFGALMTALSGTVGIGNIANVAVAIGIGGPGAVFWMIVAGFLGMSSKFVECTLGVKYRRKNRDGSVSGGPMYYIEKAFDRYGLSRFGKGAGAFYAVGIILASL